MKLQWVGKLLLNNIGAVYAKSTDIREEVWVFSIQRRRQSKYSVELKTSHRSSPARGSFGGKGLPFLWTGEGCPTKVKVKIKGPLCGPGNDKETNFFSWEANLHRFARVYQPRSGELPEGASVIKAGRTWTIFLSFWNLHQGIHTLPLSPRAPLSLTS